MTNYDPNQPQPVVLDQYGQPLTFNGYDQYGQPMYIPQGYQPIQSFKKPKGSPKLGIISLALIPASYVFSGIASLSTNSQAGNAMNSPAMLVGLFSSVLYITSIVLGILAIKRNQGRVYGIIAISISGLSLISSLLLIVGLIVFIGLMGTNLS